MATIAGLAVSLTAKADGFVRGMGKAKKEAVGFGKTVDGLQSAIGGLGVALGGAAIVNGVKGAFEGLDRIAKLSDRIGVTTETLAGLQHGAGLSGAAAAQLNDGLLEFVKLLGEAQLGTGKAVQGLDFLGLSLERITTLPTRDALLEVSDAIARLNTESDRAFAADALFGGAGKELLTFLSGGRSQLEGFVAEAERLGIAFNRLELKRVEDANDALARARATLGGIIDRLAVDLAPEIESAAESAADLAGSLSAAAKFSSGLTPIATDLGGIVLSVGAIVLGVKGIGAMGKAFGAWGIAATGLVATVSDLWKIITGNVAETTFGRLADWAILTDKSAERAKHEQNVAAFLAKQEEKARALKALADQRSAAEERAAEAAKKAAEAADKAITTTAQAIDKRINQARFGTRGALRLELTQQGVDRGTANFLTDTSTAADALDMATSAIERMRDEINTLKGVDGFKVMIDQLRTIAREGDILPGVAEAIRERINELGILRHHKQLAERGADLADRTKALADQLNARGGATAVGAVTRGSIEAFRAERSTRAGLKSLEDLQRQGITLDRERNDLLRDQQRAPILEPVSILN